MRLEKLKFYSKYWENEEFNQLTFLWGGGDENVYRPFVHKYFFSLAMLCIPAFINTILSAD